MTTREQVLKIDAKHPGQGLYELWSERAAIREYDGGFKREEAERLAMRDIEEQLQ